jgi:SnoaL-like domain
MAARELLNAAYTSFNTRDLDGALRLMHTDVDWPNGMEGGRVHGHAGVRDYWTRQWGMIDPHVEPVGFATDEAGDTVVSVHQVVRDLEGKVLVDQMVTHVYTLEDRLIRRMEIRSPEIRDSEEE